MSDVRSPDDMRDMFCQVIGAVAGTHPSDLVAAQSALACAMEWCPECHGRFAEPDPCEMEDGDTDYVVCPHCGALLALDMRVEVHFYERVCTPEEFADMTGEEVGGHAHE